MDSIVICPIVRIPVPITISCSSNIAFWFLPSSARARAWILSVIELPPGIDRPRTDHWHWLGMGWLPMNWLAIGRVHWMYRPRACLRHRLTVDHRNRSRTLMPPGWAYWHWNWRATVHLRCHGLLIVDGHDWRGLLLHRKRLITPYLSSGSCRFSVNLWRSLLLIVRVSLRMGHRGIKTLRIFRKQYFAFFFIEACLFSSPLRIRNKRGQSFNVACQLHHIGLKRVTHVFLSAFLNFFWGCRAKPARQGSCKFSSRLSLASNLLLRRRIGNAMGDHLGGGHLILGGQVGYANVVGNHLGGSHLILSGQVRYADIVGNHLGGSHLILGG